jgi:signal transduction histidine kinase
MCIAFNLKDNINKNLGILKGSLKIHDINVLLECEKEITINSYPNELTQIFINIIHNSKDALKINDIEKRYIFINVDKR